MSVQMYSREFTAVCRAVLCLAAGMSSLQTQAQTAPQPVQADAPPVTVVTANRVPQFLGDVPASVDVVPAWQVREAGPLINLSEALARVPGLGVLNRQNYAQDLQISSRGFGSRSTFGVRGVRLYEDGIPLTMPDGQGQTSSFDLDGAQRIEVLRGPASALYGNAAGGVIQVFSEEGPPKPELSVGLARGRDGLQKASVKAAGQQGSMNYVLNASQTDTDGYRQHSEMTRYQARARLQWALGTEANLTLIGSHLVMPEVQDPLGLTAAQLAQNPQQPGSNALLYNTRKRIENSQLGGIYERQFQRDTLRLMVYGGRREVTQFQSIPRATQMSGAPLVDNPAHPGGVIDLNRRFAGFDARYTAITELLQRPLTVTGGVSFDQMIEHRQGFENFDDTVSPIRFGVLGDLRRDEENTARNNDQYLMGQWDVDPAWQASVGLRHSDVKFKSADHHIVTGNGDDSGRMSFEATTPTASLLWRLNETVRAYATLGRSFETPTLNEVAYQDTAGTSTGWNNGLKASKASHYELGVKTGYAPALSGQVAVFQIDTKDEIAVSQSSGGRATYQNVGETQRRGLEAAMRWRIQPGWFLNASATWTRAEYADAFTSTSNGVATTVQAGNALPGVPRRTAFAEIVWRSPQYWHAALEWRHSGSVWANDTNTQNAASYQLLSARAGWKRGYGDWRVEALLRVDNLANVHTVGSVIVNEANQRYFEPAPGRSATVAMYLTRVF
jgi:iron complex outermembrane receptor protein